MGVVDTADSGLRNVVDNGFAFSPEEDQEEIMSTLEDELLLKLLIDIQHIVCTYKYI
jgi:hypothetical protein